MGQFEKIIMVVLSGLGTIGLSGTIFNYLIKRNKEMEDEQKSTEKQQRKDNKENIELLFESRYLMSLELKEVKGSLETLEKLLTEKVKGLDKKLDRLIIDHDKNH